MAEEVLAAFETAEAVRGPDWVRSTTFLPGGVRQWGFSALIPIIDLARKVTSLRNAVGADNLLQRLRSNDYAAESELSAIHLLRSSNPETELEIPPVAAVGDRQRQPDFAIRMPADDWTQVEVTALHRSAASSIAQQVLQSVVGGVMAVEQAFLLEVVFLRFPTEVEVQEVVSRAHDICSRPEPQQSNLKDLALLIVKPGDPSVVVPTVLPSDDRPRAAVSQVIVGDGRPNRQVIVRVPFSDQRAEDVLTAEARQLPKGMPGLIMVDVQRQPTALTSWPTLVPRRFTPQMHTRVGAVMLFMYAIRLIDSGLALVPHVKMIENPHAKLPLPSWIRETIDRMRETLRRTTGQRD
ncbi:MAG: hypothetical protein ACLQGU_13030 [bacterium]